MSGIGIRRADAAVNRDTHACRRGGPRLSLIQRYWAVLPAKAAGSRLRGRAGEDYVGV
ncbi:hypothetical protein [Lysobacter gummosus]|uniref:hypothetical protein n=1 Tax=Lysobacter gummosus TaxID=262324 RepID=UPI0036443A90